MVAALKDCRMTWLEEVEQDGVAGGGGDSGALSEEEICSRARVQRLEAEAAAARAELWRIPQGTMK